MQRHPPKVTALEVGGIEQEVQDRLGTRGIEGVLERVEIGDAVGVHDHRFAIEPGRPREPLKGLGERLHAGGPVVAVPGEEPRRAILEARHDPISVELNLVDPLAGRRQFLRQRAKLRSEPSGQRAFDSARQFSEKGRHRTTGRSGRLAARPCRFVLIHVASDTVSQEAFWRLAQHARDPSVRRPMHGRKGLAALGYPASVLGFRRRTPGTAISPAQGN
jgi:hypothetical protein